MPEKQYSFALVFECNGKVTKGDDTPGRKRGDLVSGVVGMNVIAPTWLDAGQKGLAKISGRESTFFFRDDKAPVTGIVEEWCLTEVKRGAEVEV